MKIHITISTKELFAFSMYNSYSGYLGVFNAAFTLGALILLVSSWGSLDGMQKVLLLFCLLMFTVIQPVMLYRKSAKQAKQSTVSAPMDLILSDEKITVEQRGDSGDVLWNQIWKVVALRSTYVLRIGPTRGFLIPKAAVADHEQEFIEIVKRNLPKSKTKGLKA